MPKISKWGSRKAVKLKAGERITWPITNFLTTQDHLLGAMQGMPFIRIKANLALPGLPIECIQKLKLELIATQDNDFIEHVNSTTPDGIHWLNNEILVQLGQVINSPAGSLSLIHI